jgi:hypothetical protein
MLENFTKSELSINSTVKSFIHIQTPRYVERITTPHSYELNDRSLTVAVDYHPTNCHFAYDIKIPLLACPAYIAHYEFQSYDNYIKRKIRIPRDDLMGFRDEMTHEELHKKYNDMDNFIMRDKYNEKNKAMMELYKVS